MTANLKVKQKLYDISIGDKFYHDNYSTHQGQALPDYLIVQEIKDGFVTATYENHYVYTKERVFSLNNLWSDSNLNPHQKKPEWVFLR